MGNSVKGTSQDRDVDHKRNSDDIAITHGTQVCKKQSENLSSGQARDRLAVKEISHKDETSSLNIETESLNVVDHRETESNDDTEKQISLSSQARKSQTVSKFTSRYRHGTPFRPTRKVPRTKQHPEVENIPQPLESLENVSKKHPNTTMSVSNTNTRGSAFQNVQNTNIRSRAKSDPVQRRPDIRSTHTDEVALDKTPTDSGKRNKIIQKPPKFAPDALLRSDAVNIVGETVSKNRARSDPVTFRRKPEEERHVTIPQEEKVGKGIDTMKSASNLIVRTNKISLKSSKSLTQIQVSDKAIKEQDKTINTRRVQSDPVSLQTVNTLKEPGLDALLEEDRADSRRTLLSEQELETEITACSIDTEGREYEISSSLRSTALDSRLFESESSIVTHTSTELQKPASRYSDNKQKLKAGLIDLYKFRGFDLSAFPVLPANATEKLTETPQYWPPWMTVQRRIMTEEDLEQVEQYDTVDYIDMNGYERETKVNKIHDIFHHEEQEVKNVYVMGESGTGKTAFCRHLIQQWCRQHQQERNNVGSNGTTFHDFRNAVNSSEQDRNPENPAVSKVAGNHVQFDAEFCNAESTNSSQNNNTASQSSFLVNSDQVFDDQSEVAKYEFLFYIPLCYSTNHEHIHDMIKTQYKNILNRMNLEENIKGTKSNPIKHGEFLNELLQKDSEKILILLDGLDQWRPSRKRYKAHKPSTALPLKDASKHYTILTTSSSQKLKEINIEATSSDLEITLYGIEEKTSHELIKHVIDRLNKYHGQKKKSEDMIRDLNSWKAKKYQHLPYTLEALVYLWYHSGIIGNTFCDIFSRILELQLKCFDDSITISADKPTKTPVQKPSKQFSEVEIDVQLPRYFINLSNCQKNKKLVYLLGKNAWLTRKQRIKVFDFSEFIFHGYSWTDIHSLVKAGILIQQKFLGFSELEYSKKVFFADERVQEFLATTYIAVMCRNEAYENMGNIDIHTSKIRKVVDTYLDVFVSIESMAEFSDMIVMLCGLYPPTVEQLTQKIYDTVSKDKRVLEYRNNLEFVSEDNVLSDIQELIFDCANESVYVNTDSVTLHIGDMYYENSDTMHLKYIVSEEVESLSINANEASQYSPEAVRCSEFIYQCRIFSRLQKLLIKDEISHLTLQDIEYIHILSERCVSTLKAISYVFSNANRVIYQRITLDLDRLLPMMTHLIELELRHIKLGHNKFSSLSSVLSDTIYLKRLFLYDITCEMQRCDGEEHKMDFSDYKNLELIDIDGKELPVVGVNKSHIIKCFLGNLPQGPEIRTFSSLRKAKHLKHFTQKVRQRPPFISQTLIQTLNTWHMLETLQLEGVNFGENDLILNKELKSLFRIRLVETRMSRVAWRHFVDCLPAMARRIVVVTRGIHITPIDEDVTRDSLRRPIDAETRAILLAKETERQEAFEYVRGKKNIFSIVFDKRDMFDFELI